MTPHFDPLVPQNVSARSSAQSALSRCVFALVAVFGIAMSPLMSGVAAGWLFALAVLPAVTLGASAWHFARRRTMDLERAREEALRGGKEVLGSPPKRECFAEALEEARQSGKKMLDKYLVGFSLETGEPLWVDDDEICAHAAVFAKTGVGKTLWLESLMFQQMARGRASGCTFIDAKRDSSTLANVILMALVTGRIEDLVVIDPFDPVHAYNFTLTTQRADVKARKVLRAGLPATSDQSVTKHYDRLAADSIYRMVRALESLGLAWSIRDVAVALSAFHLAYPHLREMLQRIGARQALVELGHLASSYRSGKGTLDASRMAENLRGIASELLAISGSEAGEVFCTNYSDLVLSDAILRGKIIYFMLPRLEEAESAARMVKVFREDLEVSIGEITSSRQVMLEDPHLVFLDEGSPTFGPTWANLFELARRGRFGLIFGAQSTGGLTDEAVGLSQAFYERVMANVNLKVLMRVGDNRTAKDMAEWFGKVSSTKRSVGSGISTSLGTLSKGAIDGTGPGGARAIESQSVSSIETEEDLVRGEELKHQMSAEKGLAWFDLGNGRIVKGRSFWLNAEIPDNWDGRDFLVRTERIEVDDVGLADWVDEQILSQEEKELVRQRSGGSSREAERDSTPGGASRPATNSSNSNADSPGGGGEKGKKSPQPFRVKTLSRGPRASTNTYPRPSLVSVTSPDAPTGEDKGKEGMKGAKSGPEADVIKLRK